MSQRTPYGQGMRHRQFRESAGDDHIGGHSSLSDVKFDSSSPHTPHSYTDGPSSTPTEVGGSSTPFTPPQNRIMIYPLGSSFDNILCKRHITRIIQSKFENLYTSWKKIDPSVRDMWFGEFKKSWSWESELENQIRINFEKIASDRIIDLLFRVRRELTKKPSWMCPVVFEALKEYWNSPEFKNKSEKTKKNWSSDVGGSKHTCGSIPMSEHKKRLSKLLGRPPTQAELFIAMHQRKDHSGFVDSKSEKTYADLQMRQASSQSSAVGPTENSDAAGSPRSQLLMRHHYGWRLQVGKRRAVCMAWGLKHMSSLVPIMCYRHRHRLHSYQFHSLTKFNKLLAQL